MNLNNNSKKGIKIIVMIVLFLVISAISFTLGQFLMKNEKILIFGNNKCKTLENTNNDNVSKECDNTSKEEEPTKEFPLTKFMEEQQNKKSAILSPFTTNGKVDDGFTFYLTIRGNVYAAYNGKLKGTNTYEIEEWVSLYNNEVKTLEGFKLDIDNVVTYVTYPAGNHGVYNIAFLRADGTVSVLDGTALKNNYIIKLTHNILNLKNIITLVPGTEYNAIAIDIDGNQTMITE